MDKGQPVITFEIDRVHDRPEGTASRNFNQHREKFIEGEDYFIINASQKDEFRLLEIPNRGLTLLTESGYLLLCKSLTDDRAWQVQAVKQFIDEELEKCETWNDARGNKFITPLCGNAGGFAEVKKTGAGQTTIKKFLDCDELLWPQKQLPQFPFFDSSPVWPVSIPSESGKIDCRQS